MKKNKTMRAGALLLALTLVTSCFVGGTWAKYTTSGSGSDTARVAKFGVTVTGTGNMFAETYNSETAGFTGVTVSSETKVVAPGTKGDMAAISITGTPEVAVQVTYEATEFDLGDKWMAKKDGDTAESFYCPLEITVKSTAGTTVLKGTDTSYNSVDDFETAVKNAIAGYSKTYGPGINLADKASENLTVSWAWAFDTNDDVKDTYLGDQAATNNAANIKLTVKTTVTQID